MLMTHSWGCVLFPMKHEREYSSSDSDIDSVEVSNVIVIPQFHV